MVHFCKISILILTVGFFSAASGLAADSAEKTPAVNIDTIIAELKNPDPAIRMVAALILADLKDSRDIAAPALVRTLEDKDPAVRAAAVIALGKLDVNDDKTIEAVTAMLEDENEEVRAAAADALTAPPTQYVRPAEKNVEQTDDPNLDNWQPGRPRPKVESDPTGFRTPLTNHHNNLYAIHKQITTLANAPEPGNNEELARLAGEYKAVGLKALAEGQALQKQLHAFINAKTRSGTDAEISLAKGNVRTFAVIVRDYQNLIDFEPGRDTASLKTVLLQEAKAFALERLKQKIAERFDSKGLTEILNSASWKQAQDTALTVLAEKANQRLETVTQNAVGLGFHDLNSLRAALRQRVDTVVKTHIEEMLINLSGKGLVIKIIGREVITWLAEEFWSKVKQELREALRQKGQHEFRVNRSIATLENARRRINALPPDARLTAVDAALSNATWTADATRYLVADLSGAVRKHAAGALTQKQLAALLAKIPSPETRRKLQQGQASPEFLEDMLLDDLSPAARQNLRQKLTEPALTAMLDELSYLALLNAAKEDLRRAAAIAARGRFLLQNREKLLELTEDEELLKQLVEYLKKLVAAVDVPDTPAKTAGPQQLYLRWYEVLGPDGRPVPADKPRSGQKKHKPGDVTIIGLWTEFYYVDLDLVKQHREYWRAQGKDDLADAAPDKLPYPPKGKPHHARYDKTYLAKITANGQTIYLQRASGLTEWGGTEERTWTCGRILGLTEGTHQAEVSAVTDDRIRYDSKISFVVEPLEPRRQNAVDSSKKSLDELRQRIENDRAAGRTPSLANLPGNLIHYAEALLNAGQGTGDQILALLAEAQNAAAQVRDIKVEEAVKMKRPQDSAHRSFIRYMFDITKACFALGGDGAYRQAQSAFQQAREAFDQNADTLREGGTKLAFDMDSEGVLQCYPRLAMLAISAGSSAEEAVEYLQEWEKLRRESGQEIDEQYEKKQRLSYPKEISF
ncbi:MAG: HEAT repeat domain-containing protein [Sedimentisphaerales bacterium]|nr:HEAT repeat domain-containing protein [Sedimentisphaerales bacterium]